MKKIVIIDIYDKEYSHVKMLCNNNQVELLDPNELSNMDSEYYISTLSDTIILSYGYKCYEVLKELNTRNIIHFGIRKANYKDICSMPYLSIKNNVKIIQRNRFIVSSELDSAFKYLLSDEIQNQSTLLPPPVEYIGLNKWQELKYFEGKEVGFDFETVGLNNEPNLQILGFSFASLDRIIYIDFTKNLLDKENALGYKDFLDWWLSYLERNSSNIWTYNVSFEQNVVNQLYSKRIPLQDSMVLVICAGAVERDNRSLKFNAQKYLGIPSWDDDLDQDQHNMSLLFKDYPNYFDFNNSNNGFNEILNEYGLSDLSIERFKKYWGNTWGCSNQEVMANYCGLDSYYTLCLKNRLYDKFIKSYPVYLTNAYMGAVLNSNGITIDVDKTYKLKEVATSLCENSKRYMDYVYLTSILELYNFDDFIHELNPRLKRLLDLDPSILLLEPKKIAKQFLILIDDKEQSLNNDLLQYLLVDDEYLDEFSWVKNEVESFSTRKSSYIKPLLELLNNVFDVKQLFATCNQIFVQNMQEYLLSNNCLQLERFNIVANYFEWSFTYEDYLFRSNNTIKECVSKLLSFINNDSSLLESKEELMSWCDSYIDFDIYKNLLFDGNILDNIDKKISTYYLDNYPKVITPSRLYDYLLAKKQLEKHSEYFTLYDDLEPISCIDYGSIALQQKVMNIVGKHYISKVRDDFLKSHVESLKDVKISELFDMIKVSLNKAYKDDPKFLFLKDSNVWHEDPEVRFHRFMMCYSIYKATTKDLTTYLKKLTENTYTYKLLNDELESKVVYRSNDLKENNLLKERFFVNGKSTKRWASSLHTYSSGSDYMACIIPSQPDRCFTYFDIDFSVA